MDTWAPDENPLLIRYIHTRLRRGGAMTTVGIVAIACLGILVVGSMIADSEGTPPDRAARVMFYVVLAVPAVLLLFGGTHRVSLAITMERASGVLETLRLTPMHPGVGLAGYLLGPPLQEIAAALAAAPFLLYCVLRGGVPFVDAFQYAVLIGTTALLFYLLAAVGALATPAGQPQKRSGLAVGFLFMVFVVPNVIRMLASAAPMQAGGQWPFFGVGLPFFFILLLGQAVLGAFLAIAAARKLAREGAPAFSKRQAVAFHAAIHLLLLGLAWEGLAQNMRLVTGTGAPLNAFSGWMIGMTIGGGLLGLWLIALSIPTPLAFYREHERARARAEAPRPWSEGASQVRWTFALAGISAAFLLVPAALLLGSGTPPADIGLPALLVPLLLAALFVQFGASREALALRFRKHGGGLHLLLQTALWALPGILGLVIGIAGASPTPGALAASLSPAIGIAAALIATGGDTSTILGPHALTVATVSLGVQAALAAFFLARLRRVHRRIAEHGPYRPATPPEAAA